MTDLPKIEVIVPEDELLAQIDKLADTLAPRLTGACRPCPVREGQGRHHSG